MEKSGPASLQGAAKYAHLPGSPAAAASIPKNYFRQQFAATIGSPPRSSFGTRGGKHAEHLTRGRGTHRRLVQGRNCVAATSSNVRKAVPTPLPTWRSRPGNAALSIDFPVRARYALRLPTSRRWLGGAGPGGPIPDGKKWSAGTPAGSRSRRTFIISGLQRGCPGGRPARGPRPTKLAPPARPKGEKKW